MTTPRRTSPAQRRRAERISDFTREALTAVLGRRRPRRMLLIDGRDALTRERLPIEGPPGSRMLILARGHSHSTVRCRTRQLPFEHGAFDVVVLLHSVRDGDEPELAEACRVLAGGGELLVVGWNRWGYAGRFVNPQRWPRLRAGALKRCLATLGMTPERTFGFGLASHAVGIEEGRWWQFAIKPVSDVHMLHCRHETGAPDVRLVRFQRPVAVLHGGNLAGARNAQARERA